MNHDNQKPELSNRPVPKPAPRSSFLRKLTLILSTVVLLFGAGTMKLYSDSVARPPWEWDGTDWQSYLSFSRATAKDASQRLKKSADEVDWDRFRAGYEKFAQSTKELWGRLTEVERNIEKRLGIMREKRGAEPESAASADPAAAAPEAAAAQPKSDYERGLECMRDAIGAYRGADGSQSELKRARECFFEARQHLESALEKAPEHEKPDLESIIQQCNQYMYDCMKQEKA